MEKLFFALFVLLLLSGFADEKNDIFSPGKE